MASSIDEIVFNYKFQNPDIRDYKFTPSNTALAKTNATRSFILQNGNKTNTIILNQGSLGSCVSTAYAQCINIMTQNTLAISRLHHYYCGRAAQGTSSLVDSGLNIRQAANIISKYGAARENIWPYIESNFNKLPTLNIFQQSKFFQKYAYTFINQDLNTLKSCIIQTGCPIIFGILVYSSFVTTDVAKTGNVPMPKSNEPLLGGHCVLMVGYNDSTQTFTCINSWGAGWGQGGFFNLPYAYVTNPRLAGDFCYLQFVY